MRHKSDAKRQQILDVAYQLLLKRDFEKISMSQIAALVGGSKTTLYNYFPDKEQLLVEVILNTSQARAQRSLDLLSEPMPLMEKLRQFAIAYVSFMLTDELIAIRCMVLTRSFGEKVGPQVYDRGVRAGWGVLAEFFKKEMEEGRMVAADPWFAAMQLKSLVELDLVNRRMIGIDKEIDHAEICRTVEAGLALFKSFYFVNR